MRGQGEHRFTFNFKPVAEPQQKPTGEGTYDAIVGEGGTVDNSLPERITDPMQWPSMLAAIIGLGIASYFAFRSFLPKKKS